MSSLHIRPFAYSDADYAAKAALQKAVNPASTVTVEKLKFWDQWWDPKFRHALFLVERDGQIIATGSYAEWIWWYEPGRYHISVEVHPQYRRQGIGTALYDHLQQRLATENPQGRIFMTTCRENQPEAIRFLTQRSFQQTGSELWSELQVEKFDPQRYAASLEQMRQQGITILTYPELVSDPLCHRKCYELASTSMQAMPAGGERTQQTFEQYEQQIFANAEFIPAAFFVALDQGRYVGVSHLKNEYDDLTRLATDYTGVIPSHRRRGIATALKFACIHYAHTHGVKTIVTGNDATNPMYELNRQLGFTPLPAELYFERKLS